MNLVYKGGGVALFNQECLSVLRALPSESIDSVVTDPPYGLSKTDPDHVIETMAKWAGGDYEYVPPVRGGFMGKSWDSFVPPPAVWIECFRVLKPGGHLLTFAGSRTQDLMGLAVRIAGFEIRDSVAWLYGSGFPKSMDVSKAIDKAAGAEREVVGRKQVSRMLPTDVPFGEGLMAGGVQAGEVDVTAPATEAAQQWNGWGTALKPAFEPVVVARKPLTGTVAANVLEHGTGALNIDGCRVGDEKVTTHSRGKATAFPKRPGETTVEESGRTQRQDIFDRPERTGRWPANVILDESQAAALDKQSGTFKGRVGMTQHGSGTNKVYGTYTRSEQSTGGEGTEDSGASRFFYVAKAPKKERPVVEGVAHPTVKPLTLMRWLVRLVTPPGGTVLEPFAGSGTTVEAAMQEGFKCVAVEAFEDYLPLILERIRRQTEGA